jgi:glutathione peroxidase
MASFYHLKADLPGGEQYDFATLKGKVVLIVNTASAWYVFPFCMSVHWSDKPVNSQWFHTPIQGCAVWLGFRFISINPASAGLQALWDKYKEKDFALLGFPCNQVRTVHRSTGPECSLSNILNVVRGSRAWN